MKKSFIAGLLTLSLSIAYISPAVAGQGSGKDLKTLTKELSLTKEQQAQVKTVLDENKPKDKKAMTAEECKVIDDKIKAVLDDQQKAKYDEMCASKHGSTDACCMPGSKK